MTHARQTEAPPTSGRLGVGRWLLVIAGAGVAGALSWNAIATDMERSTTLQSTRSALKAAYRAQPGVLTCRGGAGLFGMSMRQTRLVVPPAGVGPDDARAAADRAVDTQDCALAPTPEMFVGAAPPALSLMEEAPMPRPVVTRMAAPVHRHHPTRPHA